MNVVNTLYVLVFEWSNISYLKGNINTWVIAVFEEHQFHSEAFCEHNSSAQIHTHMVSGIRFNKVNADCNGSLTITADRFLNTTLPGPLRFCKGAQKCVYIPRGPHV